MNGAGNRFVIVDGRRQDVMAPADIQAAMERFKEHRFDQFIVMDVGIGAGVGMRIFNADGSEVSACGNASRCVAWLMMEETGKDQATILTKAGLLRAEKAGDRRVTVDMGAPRLTQAEIPAAHGVNLEQVPLSEYGLPNGMAVGMGNPHVISFVENAEAVNLAEIGPQIEHRLDLFPERVNVSVAEVVSKDVIKLRVWERGAGLTLACGTAACATLVAAHRRGLAGRKAEVQLPGGVLTIEWRQDGHVWMTGPVEEELRRA